MWSGASWLWQLKIEGAAWARGEKGEVILELLEAGEGLGWGLGRGTSEGDGDKKVLSCPRGSQGRTGSEIRPQYTVAATPSAGSLPQELSWGDSRRGTDDWVTGPPLPLRAGRDCKLEARCLTLWEPLGPLGE